MGTWNNPITVPYQQSPMQQLIQSLALGKIGHNYNMDLAKETNKLAIEKATLLQKEASDLRQHETLQKGQIEGKIKPVMQGQAGPPQPSTIVGPAGRQFGVVPQTKATAMAAFLQKKPDATTEEIATYHKSLQKTKDNVERTLFKADENNKYGFRPDTVYEEKYVNGEFAGVTTKQSPPVPSNIFIGTQDGSVLTMPSKGKPTVRKTGVPGTGAVEPKTRARLSDIQQQSLTRFKTLDQTVDWLKDNYDPKFTGPIQGRVRSLTSSVVNDPKFKQFKNTLGQLRTIVYAESGKQINQSELAWLEKEILPRLHNPDQNFGAAMDAFQKWVRRKHSSLTADFTSQGKIVGGGQVGGQGGGHNLDKYMVGE